MIVGAKRIPIQELKTVVRSPEALEQFCIDLIPKPLQHVTAILNNQKYLVALAVRNLKGLKYEEKMEICDRLLKGVSIRGVVGVLHDLDDILENANREKLLLCLFGKE